MVVVRRDEIYISVAIDIAEVECIDRAAGIDGHSFVEASSAIASVVVQAGRLEIADDQVGAAVAVKVLHTHLSGKTYPPRMRELLSLSKGSIGVAQRDEDRFERGFAIVRIDHVGDSIAIHIGKDAAEIESGPRCQTGG